MADYDDTLIDLPMDEEVKDTEKEEEEEKKEEEEREECVTAVGEEEKTSDKAATSEDEGKKEEVKEEVEDRETTPETDNQDQTVSESEAAPGTTSTTSTSSTSITTSTTEPNPDTETSTVVQEVSCDSTPTPAEPETDTNTVCETEDEVTITETETFCQSSLQHANQRDDTADDSTTGENDPSNGEGHLSRLSSDSDNRQESVVTVEVIPLPRFHGQTSNLQSGVLTNSANQNREDSSTFVDSEVQTETVEMSDQQRLEEKLRQFQSEAKERDESSENKSRTDSSIQITEAEKQRRRNLIFDEERFEETFLKCLICREVYNESDKLPKMLHCHHTFCMDCLYQMYRVEGEFRQSLTSVFRNMPLTVKIQCPTCREGIIISEAELRRLPNDHTIMELLCFVNKTGKNDIQYCPKHQMQPLNFFCEPCIMPVCCDCTVLDHKESKGHRVVNVDEAMKKYTPIVEETLNDIRKEKTALATKREHLENTQDDLNQIQAGITDQIRKVFDSIREVIDERERELHDVAESEVERKQAVIDGHLNTISDREGDLNAEFNSLQMAKDDKDISLIFTGHKSARDMLARKVFIPTNSTAGFSITFQFSSRADTLIKQQVANLGDIIFHS